MPVSALAVWLGLSAHLAGVALDPAPGMGAPVVEGSAIARYRGEGGGFPAYANQGFRQQPGEDGLVVTVTATAGWTRAPFPIGPGPARADAIGRFAAAATADARTQAEAVARLLHALRARIRYRDGLDAPEDPEAVLAAGEASCVGLAGLAVAALGGVGIPARVVRGLLFRGEGGLPQAHRWIEVYYPDAGWTFSDPTESVNYVSPYHVVVDVPAAPDPDYAPTAELQRRLTLEAADLALLPVDLRPGRASAIGERRTVAAQFSAAVRGRTRPAARGRVRLSGRGREWSAETGENGRFAFAGLEPGRYLIEGRFGERAARLAVSVAAGELQEVEVKLE